MNQDEKIVYEAIKELISENGYSPTIEEIQERAGKTYGTTYLLIESLQDTHHKITKVSGRARSIQIVKRVRSRKKSA